MGTDHDGEITSQGITFQRIISGRLPLLLALAGLAAIFFFRLPSTVQNHDSGELVANSYGLNVLHPPGFPLYLWLQHFWTQLLPVGSVFWRAALLNLIFSLGALAVVGWRIHRSALGAACIVLPLAFSKTFWAYSLLPEVFMLNLVLLASICALYLYAPVSKARTLGVCLLFALGSANNPSIVFVLPIVGHVLFQGKLSWQSKLGAFLASLAVVSAAYLSLLLLHSDSLFSWGRLHSLGDLLPHMLRRDYGTLQLTGQTQSASFSANTAGLLKTVLTQTPLSLLLATLPLLNYFFSRKLDPRYLVVLASLGAYVCIFLALANVDVSTRGNLILEAFFLFPLVALAMLAGFGLNSLAKTPPLWVLYVVAALGLGSSACNYRAYQKQNNLAGNTVIEDYAHNLLNMIDDDARAFVLVDSDVKVFALRYLQLIKAEHPGAIVLSQGMMFDRRQLEKIKVLRPDFRLAANFDQGPHALDVFKQFIEPNLKKFDFYLTKNIGFPQTKATYLALGRKISAGSGVQFDEASVTRIRHSTLAADLPVSLEFNEHKSLFAEYAYFDLKRGLLAQSRTKALAFFSQALQTVPYCLPALGNICVLKKGLGEDDRECLSQLQKMQQLEFNYY